MKSARIILLTTLCALIFKYDALSQSFNSTTAHRENVYFYWIHGLNDNYTFWKHMCDALTPNNGSSIILSYDSSHKDGVHGIANELNKKMRNDKKIILIGHSAGGVIARQIANINDNVLGIITVGSPNRGAGIVSSVESGTYLELITGLEEKVKNLINNTLHTAEMSGFPFTTFMTPAIEALYDFTLGSFLNDIIDHMYKELDLYVSPLSNQQLFWDLAPDSHLITTLNSSDINIPQICIRGEEDEWQLFRVIGTALNLNSIKMSGLSNGYDTRVIEYVYECLNVIAEVIHYHNIAYDALGWAGIAMPWLLATREAIIPSRNNWESMARYLNIGVHTDWSEEIGACHYEQRTIRVPIYDPAVTHIGTNNPSSGGNGSNQDTIYDTPAGFIGYEDRIETVFIYEPHDGIVGGESAYSPNAGIVKYPVQGINHLEMGSLDTPLLTILDKAINKILEAKLPSVTLTDEATSTIQTTK